MKKRTIIFLIIGTVLWLIFTYSIFQFFLAFLGLAQINGFVALLLTISSFGLLDTLKAIDNEIKTNQFKQK